MCLESRHAHRHLHKYRIYAYVFIEQFGVNLKL